MNLLVDAGDGISRALLCAEISFLSIDAIQLSHFHPDHYTGLPALLVQMKMCGRSAQLKIFVHKKEENFLRRFILNSYLFEERLGFEIIYCGFDFEKINDLANSFSFLAKKNSHFNDYKSLAEKHSLPNLSSSFLFMNENVRLHYTADIGDESDLLLFEKEKPNYLISETTHVSLEAIKKIQTEKKYKRVVLTHLPDELVVENFSAELETTRIFAASDGSEFDFN